MKNKFKFKANYVVIPAFVFLTSLAGNLFTSRGMEWYDTLQLPGFVPPGSVIGMVWTVIFILGTIAILKFYNNPKTSKDHKTIGYFLLINALLNIFWSALFFGAHFLDLAVLEMIILNLVNLTLIVLWWEKNRVAAILWTPYFLWVSFATYLAFTIWTLN